MKLLLGGMLAVLTVAASVKADSSRTTSQLVNGASFAVDGQSVVDQLLKLATFSDDPNPAVARILFTPQDMEARIYIMGLMADVGLDVRVDSVGNIFGRWTGTDADAGAVLTGSHCDAIPLAGAYDGTLGVVGAIAALAALKEAGFQPRRSLEVVMFTSEEPTRFGLSCTGSRAMVGAMTADFLDKKRDENGTTFIEAAREAGYGSFSTQDMLDEARLPDGRYSYFVELHIEQGPLLEEEGLDIGIVTAIAAPAALKVEFTGTGGHAGALLMHFRNDAALAGAELALAVEKHVLATKSEDTVGTTGVFEISPGAVNSVPRVAKLGIDIRDVDGKRRDRVLSGVLADAETIAARRKVTVSTTIVNQDPPATCDDEILTAITSATKHLQLSTKRMVSRAYHDSLFIARAMPTAMIFIPCFKGYSHRPDEFSSPKDIANGVSVLALTMADLSGGTWASPSKTEL